MKVLIKKNNIKLDKPFKYFLATLDSLPYSLITIISKDGFSGIGEIASCLDINGETQSGVQSLLDPLNSILGQYNTVESYTDVVQLMEKIKLYINFNAGVMCGIEQALFDILCKKTGKSLLEVFGWSNELKKIQTTIPYQSNYSEYKESINKIVMDLNPDFVKFKIGHNYDLELKAIKYLRSISKKISISVDANQSFSNVDEALLFSKKLSKYDVKWAEQLLPKSLLKDWEELLKNSPIPLMVDESLQSPIDAEYYAKNNIDYFNLKLAKSGGIIEGLKILKIAKGNNIPVMLGSMLHGEIGLLYNLTFALSQNFVTHDFYSYFSVTETKNLNYINNKLEFSYKTVCNKN